MFEKRGIPFVLLDLTCLVLGMPFTPFSRLSLSEKKQADLWTDIIRRLILTLHHHVSGGVNVRFSCYLTWYTTSNKYKPIMAFIFNCYTHVFIAEVFCPPDNKIGSLCLHCMLIRFTREWVPCFFKRWIVPLIVEKILHWYCYRYSSWDFYKCYTSFHLKDKLNLLNNATFRPVNGFSGCRRMYGTHNMTSPQAWTGLAGPGHNTSGRTPAWSCLHLSSDCFSGDLVYKVSHTLCWDPWRVIIRPPGLNVCVAVSLLLVWMWAINKFRMAPGSRACSVCSTAWVL